MRLISFQPDIVTRYDLKICNKNKKNVISQWNSFCCWLARTHRLAGTRTLYQPARMLIYSVRFRDKNSFYFWTAVDLLIKCANVIFLAFNLKQTSTSASIYCFLIEWKQKMEVKHDAQCKLMCIFLDKMLKITIQ